jgi:hypothetical protein
MTLINDEKALISCGLLFTTYERKQMFDWFSLNLHEILAGVSRADAISESTSVGSEC